ncbi:MAG: hypothetical protein D6752_05520 [Candidatus Nitrosothermus koennekii]|nr:MAG: hypothetical protein D6752_05520 [Candidatus Nitrosothermus koennekii]
MGDEYIEGSHKALLIAASVILKSFLMVIVTSSIFCNTIDPSAFLLQECSNYGYIATSLGAIIALAGGFGFFMIRIKAFDSIFAKVMKTDFLVTAMYFTVAFIAPTSIAPKVMIWLFGLWIFGMLLAPFNKERTLWKKITEYGGLVALGAFLAIDFIEFDIDISRPITLGMIVSSIMSVFGSGRTN